MKTRRAYRQGFTIAEMLIVLPLLVFFLIIITWALKTQFDVSRAIANQAHRQETMHRILGVLRSDMLSAESMSFSSFDEIETPPAELSDLDALPAVSPQVTRSIQSRLTLSSNTKSIEYFVLQDKTSDGVYSDNAGPTSSQPRQFVVRLATDEATPSRVWPLRDLVLTLSPPVSDSGENVELLRVVFQSSATFDRRLPANHQFDTTLRIGGSR